MPYYTYIIESESTARLYIGQTNNLEDRLHRHNNNQNKYTKGKGPFRLLHSKSFETRSEAIALELKLKKWKSSKRVKSWIARHSASVDPSDHGILE